MRETLAALEEITGIPAPKIQIPYWVALAVAYVNETIASVTGKPPRAPLAGVRMAKYKMWFNPAKAIRELGLPQTPPKQAFADAVAWFRANGYVKTVDLRGRNLPIYVEQLTKLFLPLSHRS